MSLTKLDSHKKAIYSFFKSKWEGRATLSRSTYIWTSLATIKVFLCYYLTITYWEPETETRPFQVCYFKGGAEISCHLLSKKLWVKKCCLQEETALHAGGNLSWNTVCTEGLQYVFHTTRATWHKVRCLVSWCQFNHSHFHLFNYSQNVLKNILSNSCKWEKCGIF